MEEFAQPSIRRLSDGYQDQETEIHGHEETIKAEGKTEGGAGVLIRPLTKVCGPLPEEVQQRVRALPYSELEVLGEDLLGFRSLGDLRQWLDTHPN